MQPSCHESCAGVEVSEGELTIFTSALLEGKEEDLGVFALARVMNELALKGAMPVGVTVQITLPESASEAGLKTMMEAICRAAEEQQISVLGADARVSASVTEALVNLTGVGSVKKEKILSPTAGRADQDIVLTGWIGLEGMLRAYRVGQKELESRFVPAFLQRISDCEPCIFAQREIALARAAGVRAMHQIAEGGILAALWELAEAADVGLEVWMKQMSIRQETVEVCEFFRLNPYQLTSTGSILMLSDHGEDLCETLRRAGIQAAVIGHTTGDRERVLLGGEEKRYLDRPAQDELLKLEER